jgi:hypothetical protein
VTEELEISEPEGIEKLIEEATALAEEAVENVFVAVQKIHLAREMDARAVSKFRRVDLGEGQVRLFPAGPTDNGELLIDFEQNFAELRFWHIDDTSWELFHTSELVRAAQRGELDDEDDDDREDDDPDEALT